MNGKPIDYIKARRHIQPVKTYSDGSREKTKPRVKPLDTDDGEAYPHDPHAEHNKLLGIYLERTKPGSSAALQYLELAREAMP